MITVGDKTIKQPYVAVDGEWKKVSAEYTMVNGEWKEIFPNKATYTVNIYRYGSLYQTLSVTEGESVTLPSLGVGFATASDSTTTAYNSGVTITPTGNMTLYAVFSYSIKIYRFGSLYQTLTSKSQSNKGSFTLPSYGAGYATTSSSTTISYNNGAALSSAGATLYIVYEYSIKLYKYGSLYDTLTAKSQSSTGSFTLPTCTADTGDTFYGWTTTSGSTTRNYTSGQTVSTGGMTLYAIFSYTKETTTITQSTKSYVTHQSQGLGSIPESGLLPVTVNVDGTISWTAKFTNIGQVIGSGPINGNVDATLNSVGSGGEVVRIAVNGTYLSGTGSGTYAVKAGDTINASGTAGSYSTGSSYGDSTYNAYPMATVTYPVGTTTTSTEYRSTK